MKYETLSKEELSENMKKRVLLQNSPSEIKNHLQLNALKLGDYEDTKATFIAYLMIKTD